MVSRKNILRSLFVGVVLVPVVLFIVLTGILYWTKNAIVSELLETVNEDFKGELLIKESHISPFANFPYVSIDLSQVSVYEDKTRSAEPILHIKDIYLGFDLWTLLRGTMDIKSLKMADGYIRLVQYPDGSLNISNALSSEKEIENIDEEFHIDLRSIDLRNINLQKQNVENNIMVEAAIDFAKSKFRKSPNHTMVYLDSRFLLNVTRDSDTTFIRNKHFEVHTQLDYIHDQQLVMVQPSEVKLELATFRMDGSIDIDDDMNLDIRFTGTKPNFNLFMAFAPAELAPALQRYDNAGKIFFEASVTGKSINGHNPLVVADFGCEQAFFSNKITKKRLDDLYFLGQFTTGEMRNASTMEFSLLDFSAKPEAGIFSGYLKVKNFESPEIDMQLRSEFELDFLADFFSMSDLENLKGSVALTMNFHDIVDLANPEKSIEKLNESYFTELEVKNLSFMSPYFHLPLKDLDIKASMDGHEAKIDHFRMKVGNSDLSLKASISDLPAILHHTNDPVSAVLEIRSSLLDIRQLTSHDTLKRKPVNEQVTDMSMRLKFNSTAQAFTESPNLPIGEFFIEDLYAKLTNYPHTLHDFHADIFIDETDFRIIDFTGMIDKSDFHFNGRLKNYNLWFEDVPSGDTHIAFSLTSDLLQLEDLFSYGGENYVPEDYRHEEFRKLKIRGFTDLHFLKNLQSVDMTIEQAEATMKVHPMRFEKFKGRFHYEDEHLQVENFAGKVGRSEFEINLNYYVGQNDSIRKRDNYFGLKASHLDFDELFSYNPPPSDRQMTSADHEAGFNIYDVPFTDMMFDFDIKHLNYHRYMIDNFYGKARTNKDHYIFIDTLSMQAAGGAISVKGYFNGSDRNKIYFKPDMSIDRVDLDKLLLKFDNFGQDQIVAENLHGKLSGRLTGNIHVQADMVPIIDDSEIHIDFNVVDGRLDNYPAFDALSDYFKDKNLKRVRFDTLRNQLDINKGVLSIPRMTINSSLGFIEISGKQDTQMNMDYVVSIPWRVVTRAGAQKLFGSNREIDPEQVDQIQYRDESRRVRFINLKVTGTPDNYKISLGKQ